jgi:uncharacterized membrane protein
MNPSLTIIMFCTDAGTTAGAPGSVVNRFNLNPLQGANGAIAPASAAGQVSGNLNIHGISDEAAQRVKGGKKYEVTITEIP